MSLNQAQLLQFQESGFLLLEDALTDGDLDPVIDEWNVIIAKRPPGLRISMAWGITRSMTPSSSLVAILTAWNALVAGWIFSRFPGGFPKALTSSNVGSIGFSIRRSQTLLAKSFQCLSPP